MKEHEMIQIIKGRGFIVLHHSYDNGITVCDELFLLTFDNVEKAYKFLILCIE